MEGTAGDQGPPLGDRSFGVQPVTVWNQRLFLATCTMHVKITSALPGKSQLCSLLRDFLVCVLAGRMGFNPQSKKP